MTDALRARRAVSEMCRMIEVGFISLARGGNLADCRPRYSRR
jgi:hypothetical protein